MKFVPKTDFPISLGMRVDHTVLLATMVISVLTGVIFGILPALRASGEAPIAVLKEDTGKRVGRNAEGAPCERAGGGADFSVAAALDLRGIIHSQFHERAAD